MINYGQGTIIISKGTESGSVSMTATKVKLASIYYMCYAVSGEWVQEPGKVLFFAAKLRRCPAAMIFKRILRDVLQDGGRQARQDSYDSKDRSTLPQGMEGPRLVVARVSLSLRVAEPLSSAWDSWARACGLEM